MSQAVERESMDVDVLYVGAGPASLASSLHLMNRIEAYNTRAAEQGQEPIEKPTVLVIEKSASIGDHMLSGAVMNPRAIRELIPDFEAQGFPTEHICDYAGFWLFHPKGRISSPIVPPNFRKKGYSPLDNVEQRSHTKVRLWPQAAVRATSLIRPLYLREPTFERQSPLSWSGGPHYAGQTTPLGEVRQDRL